MTGWAKLYPNGKVLRFDGNTNLRRNMFLLYPMAIKCLASGVGKQIKTEKKTRREFERTGNARY